MSDAKQDAAKQLQTMIAGLAGDLRAMVGKIEADKLPTTRGHYGRYMSIIGEMSKDESGAHNLAIGKIIALALVEAGANRRGVADAYKIIFGGAL